MYIPNSYREEDRAILFDLIRHNNFGILISQSDGIPYATHVPFLLNTSDPENPILRTHLARANPHWKMLAASETALCIFQGPHDYVSPNWYDSNPNVPTWNYAAVHIYGKPTIVEDRETLLQLVSELTAHHENHRIPAWDVNNAAPLFDQFLPAIVGIEIPIEKIQGKFKFNQNKSPADQQSVADHFSAQSDTNSQSIADIMHRNLTK